MSQSATPTAEMTDADVEKYLASIVGPVGQPETMTIESGAARRMALALDNHDPVHYEKQAAVARGYRGVVAPWPLLWLFVFNCSDHHFHKHMPVGKALVHGQDEYEFYEPMIVGDDITTRTAIVEAKLKQGKSGRLGQIVEERRFTNQHGTLCAVLRSTHFRR
jgi:acyl dehydratase